MIHSIQKNISFLLTLLFFLSQEVTAQQRPSPTLPDVPDFVAGQVLFMIEDNVAKPKIIQGTISTGIPTIDNVLSQFETTDLNAVFPTVPDQPGISYKTNPQTGKRVEILNISRVYQVSLSTGDHDRTLELIEKLQNLNEIVYAEPNYIVSTQVISSFAPFDVDNLSALNEEEFAAYTPNDPLYNQQSGLSLHTIDQVWATSKGDGTSIIAILDTGVDLDHPDLAPNIWINPGESQTSNNIDTDANGYKDDLNGWDFINNDNKPDDDNRHGTHVAGIAAAVCDNNIGIAGANCNAKIMPVKVLQSTGKGDVATVSKGVTYAADNGATVINLSLGTYAESITFKNALANAYGQATIVAAAGNDAQCIGPIRSCPPFTPVSPMYPASYSFVIGVEENTAGQPLSFSNYDYDGPITSGYSDLFNYEIRAAGINILSTVPGGNYHSLSGTSMAAPLVAGAISLYHELKPDASKERLFGDLIYSTSNKQLNLFAAVNSNPIPKLSLIKFDLVDAQGGDQDYRADAGETIQITPTIRNTWGNVSNAFMTMEFAEFEDTSVLQFTKDTVQIGSLSDFATITTVESIEFILSQSVIDNREVKLLAKFWIPDNNGTPVLNNQHEIRFKTENMIEVEGVISQNQTWSGNSILLTNNILIEEGVTLTIEKGTTIHINPDVFIRVQGEIIARGTQEEPISWVPRKNEIYRWRGFEIKQTATDVVIDENYNYISGTVFEYNIFDYFNYIWVDENGIGSGPLFKYSLFSNGTDNHYSDPKILDIKGGIFYGNRFLNLHNPKHFVRSFEIERSIFVKNSFEDNSFHSIDAAGGPELMYVGAAQLLGNVLTNNFDSGNHSGGSAVISIDGTKFEHNAVLSNKFSERSDHRAIILRSIDVNTFKQNSILNLYANYQFSNGTTNNYVLSNNYYFDRTTKEEIGVYDKENDFNFSGIGLVTIDQNLTSPSEYTYPFVAGVDVNGVTLKNRLAVSGDPLGVGTHTFAIHFNTPMDTLVTPNISMGVRSPFNQTPISKDGYWSSDSKTYYVSLNVGVNTGDGNNRLNISEAKSNEGLVSAQERDRFNILIDAAGSLSGDFSATPKIGKIELNWSEPDASEVTDLIGYNVYRLTYPNLKQSQGDVNAFSDPETTLLNEVLITDQTDFIDYDVEPGVQNYYAYTVVRTNLTESDLSKVVSTAALSASIGDANGDNSVNILDVTSTILYIVGGTPEPFIFSAADLNSDNRINVVDVVQLVSKILKPKQAGQVSGQGVGQESSVSLFVDSGTVIIDSNTPVVAMQFELSNINEESTIELDESLDNFEIATSWKDSTMTVLVYNFTNTPITPGRKDIFHVVDESPVIDSAIIANTEGKEIKIASIVYSSTESDIELPLDFSVQPNFPNPFNPTTTIRYTMPVVGGVKIEVFDVLGRRVGLYNESMKLPGSHEFVFDASRLATGMYLYRLSISHTNGTWISATEKMLLIK